ncbi:GNAT family N-acetyltransferase [Virgibacillus necropolis]|uniref:GNAT family N-acetyltransferase n=1 Tax=Virgibacillus necropolis TaxID=163877 RepID=UPI00384C32F1
MYKIREAQESDYKVINQLTSSQRNMHLNEKDSIIEQDLYNESLLKVDTRWFVVEKSGEVLALIFFTIDVESRGIDVKKFTIDSEYRKKGLNEHLYKKMEQVANRKSMTFMQVDISQEQREVIDFFEQKGWKTENNYYVKYIK